MSAAAWCWQRWPCAVLLSQTILERGRGIAAADVPGLLCLRSPHPPIPAPRGEGVTVEGQS